MKARFLYICLSAVLALILLSGCTKRYVITHDLEAPLPMRPGAVITEIHDELPADFPVEKKPSAEDITKFKNYLSEELIKDEVFGSVVPNDTSHTSYEITGTFTAVARCIKRCTT